MKTILIAAAIVQAIAFPPEKTPADYYPLRLYLLQMKTVSEQGKPRLHGYGNVIEDGDHMRGVDFYLDGACPKPTAGPTGTDKPLVARWGASRTQLLFLIGSRELGHTQECKLDVKVDPLFIYDIDAQGNLHRSKPVIHP